MKELIKTPFITALLSNAVGEGVDTANLHVYEVRATSTVALRGKGGTVWERAKISPNTIAQLARAVNEDPLPLMMDHDMRGSPFGKFFYGESIPMENGETELRGYLYVDSSEEKVLTKLNAGSIDEVSIQFKPEKMLCSECSFDYMAAAAEDNYMPFITRTCDEGHQIGVDGVHINLVGVDETMELSLVSRGAAKNSKIIPPSDAKLGQEAQRLAAAGVGLDDFYCTASASDLGEEEVNFETFMAKLDTANNEKQELAVKLAAEQAMVATLTTERDARDETIVTLTAERDEATEQLNAALEASEFTDEQVTALKGYIGKQYVALKALDGDTAAEALEDVDAMLSFIGENEARLSALITPGGKSAGAAGDAGNNEDTAKAAETARLSAQADAYRSAAK
jgi:hypothetical protein